MNFIVSCACGARVGVGPGQAGTDVRCGCGRTIRVPPLSQLRQADGLPPYGSAMDAIRELDRTDTFPEAMGGDACLVCGTTSGDILDVTVECPCLLTIAPPSTIEIAFCLFRLDISG